MYKTKSFLLLLAFAGMSVMSAKAQVMIDHGYCGIAGDSANLEWVLTSDTLTSINVLTISGSGDMGDYTYPYPSVNTPWAPYQNIISELVIGDSVTYIGEYAFVACGGLTSVTIPSSVTSIGDYAFWDCYNLTSSITIHAVIPPVLGENVFDSIPIYANTPVYIPCKSYNNYISDTGWRFFSNFITTAISDTTGSLTWSLCDSTLTISGSGNMDDYTSSSTPWDSYKNAIKTLIIGDSVTSIGNVAFYDCINLDSIIIPNSLTSIGNFAFENCSSLISITFPDSLKSIGTCAFQNCSNLTSIIFSNSVTSIGDMAFAVCNSLTSVTIPHSVTTIGNTVFGGCSNLSFLSIGNSVASMGSNVFANCSSLASIISHCVIPPVLGTTAFGNVPTNIPVYVPCGSKSAYQDSVGWSDFTNYITIPDTVGTTGTLTWSLSFCDSTLIISGNGNMNDYTVVPAVNAPWAAYQTDIAAIVIGDSVTSIGESAFYGCNNLTSATIGNSVTSIGNNAFYSCRNLTSITIPDSITAIGTQAFGYCINLHTVNFDAINCVTMGTSSNPVFYACSTLTTLNINNRMKTIPNYAFSGCSGLVSITIPDNITSIGVFAFQNCSSLTSITIPDSITNIGNSVFFNCSSLQTVTFNAINCTTAGASFSNCAAFTTLNIGNQVKTIPNYLFQNCTYLTAITIPENVISIGNSAFQNCVNLHTVNFNAINCISMGNSVFLSDTAFSTLNIGNRVKTIPDAAFSGCNRLTSIIIPDSVITIGDNAFLLCGNLTSLTIGKSVTTIGESAFRQCSSLTALTIPSNVATIGDDAFGYCNGLTFIISHPTTPPVSGTFIFNGLPTNIPVYVPCGSKSVYQYSAEWIRFTNYYTLSTDSTTYTATACYNIPYTDNNFSTPILLAGVYYATLTSSIGCDSVVELTLSFYPPVPLTQYADTLCFGEIFNDNNFSNLTTAGTYYDTLQNLNGCDSIIELTLSFYPNIPLTQYADTLCFGETFNDNNFSNLTTAGTYYDTLQNTNGCDSIIELTLSFYPSISITNYSATVCKDSIYNDDNFTNLMQAGTYYDTLQNLNGCDSIVCLTLTVSLTDCIAYISGEIQRQDYTLLSSGVVMLYLVQNSGHYLLSDTVSVESDGSYIFMDVADGNYVVKIKPDTSENALPTYYGNTEHWYEADTVTIADKISVSAVDITILPIIATMTGNSLICGYVGEDYDGSQGIREKGVDRPVVDESVSLQRLQSVSWETVSRTITNDIGYFEFRNVPPGTYKVTLDVPGKEHTEPQIVEVGNDDTITNIEYIITEDSIKNNSDGVGVKQLQVTSYELQVYPNPVNYELRIINYEGGKIEIYDVVGQLLYQINKSTNKQINNEISIDVSHLSAGMYFLKVDNRVVRFVKE